MNARFDSPFPAAWTADELVDAVPRTLSSQFAAGLRPDTSIARPPAGARLRRPPSDRGLPTLFRVR